MNETDWLANLKPGDKVIQLYNGFKTIVIASEVFRTEIRTSEYLIYDKHTGRAIGRGGAIFQLTDQSKKDIDISNNFHRQIHNALCYDPSLSTLRKVVAILKEEKEVEYDE